MRRHDLRSGTKQWARIAMKLGLLATDPRVWADVNERLSARMEDMSDAMKERYDEGVERLKDANEALHGRNHWVGPTVSFLGGIALVDAQDVKTGFDIKIIKVDGHMPGETGYPIH